MAIVAEKGITMTVIIHITSNCRFLNLLMFALISVYVKALDICVTYWADLFCWINLRISLPITKQL